MYDHICDIGIELNTSGEFVKVSEKIICKICGSVRKNFQSLARHLNSSENHPNSKEYYNIYFRKEGEGICKIEGCENETKFKGFQLKFNIYCCAKHRDQCPEINKKKK